MEIVEMNWKAIDVTCEAIVEVPIPTEADKYAEIKELVPAGFRRVR